MKYLAAQILIGWHAVHIMLSTKTKSLLITKQHHRIAQIDRICRKNTEFELI